MSHIQYLYNINDDITAGVLDNDILVDDIDTNLTLSSATFHGIHTYNANLYVVFSESISGGEKTNLDSIIQNHTITSIPLIKNEIIRYYPEDRTINNTSYKKIGRFRFPGTNNTGNIGGIDIISSMESGLQDYSIQITSKKGNNSISNTTFTNTDVETNEITTILYQPRESSIIEISAKVTRNKSKKNAFIEEVIFWN